ncbi:hypothetical protein AncyloWKF20_05090 [Ancylobacter sp. WKF20]|uniref:hypothetical protein n=1 Tax=Ancylobacter sp. WKF20 TaxID=3039801 RepID=UPI00243459BE|nr:hypothetical protein [Ancylobacter sp. WKF20]WGD31199.1 hypothetical protein AncyloWKF20_05090 [Ancylobacter sp. WKF20]
MDWLTDLLDRFIADKAGRVSAAKLVAKMATGGEAGGTAYLEACRLLGEAADDGAELLATLDDVTDTSTLAQVGVLVVACFATLRVDYAARPDAVRARTALSNRAGPVVETAGDAFGHVLYGWLSNLVGEAMLQLSQIAATRAPLVRVETGVSLPAQLLAWDLYGDPSRDAELVERNNTGTAMLMPVILEALAP